MVERRTLLTVLRYEPFESIFRIYTVLDTPLEHVAAATIKRVITFNGEGQNSHSMKPQACRKVKGCERPHFPPGCHIQPPATEP